ncbi:MAG: hydroxymethylbilane synthase, partial [Candidatus Altiarchaeota archaeon]|nr:hydroxymethylbilane synthase [Candidatus Altiarchaeota archaeon]
EIIKESDITIRRPGTGILPKFKEIDLAIHSLKDIPVEIPPELEILGICERGDPRDCLVSANGGLEGLPPGAAVGSDSERRKAELLTLRDDLKVEGIRGNIPTRLEKVDNGNYDALITAKCALDRLGLQDRISQIFEVKEMVPAAGQGAVAVVKRKGDDFDFMEKDEEFTCCMLEREFIRGLGACRNPVGAYCSFDGKHHLTGLVYRDGKRITPEFDGTPQEINKKIEQWKHRFI